MATDGAGNILVTGNFRSASISFGNITVTNSGGGCQGGCWDIFVAKYNNAGVPVWARKIGGTGDEAAASIATDSMGNIYVAGNYRSASLTLGS